MSQSGKPVRRVVAANGPDGRGTIESDRVLEPLGQPVLPPGIEEAILWVVEDSPARAEQGEPEPSWTLGPLPPEGARWFEITLHPGAKTIGFHKTDTVDFVQITSGEIWLLEEDGTELLVRPGDCIVQRETVHSWDNRGAVPCTMSVVMVSTVSRSAETAPGH